MRQIIPLSKGGVTTSHLLPVTCLPGLWPQLSLKTFAYLPFLTFSVSMILSFLFSSDSTLGDSNIPSSADLPLNDHVLLPMISICTVQKAPCLWTQAKSMNQMVSFIVF